jgi:cytoskeletal protein CcmA (bactofilin family)
MFRSILTVLFTFVIFFAAPVGAQTSQRVHGGDTFIADATISHTFAADRDVFAVGKVVTARGTARGDMHLVGFDVDQMTTVGGNLLAVGTAVTMGAPVAGDVMATGMTVRSTRNGTVGGNVVLFGNTVTVDGAVSGSMTAFGQTVVLNASVDGDVWLAAKDISFGPDAIIAGRLILVAEDQISVPERVVSPDRVTYEKMQPSRIATRMKEGWKNVEYPMLPTFVSLFSAFLVSLVFFIALAAIFQSFLPKPLHQMQTAIQARPGRTFLVGVVGLSMLFGMVPIIGLTLFGIPLVPIVILGIFAVWTLGYALGAYAIAQRILRGLDGREKPTHLVRLVAFALVLIVVGVLHFIPFLGWVANYTLVLLGIGAMTEALFNRFLTDPDPALDVDMNPIDDDQTSEAK